MELCDEKKGRKKPWRRKQLGPNGVFQIHSKPLFSENLERITILSLIFSEGEKLFSKIQTRVLLPSENSGRIDKARPERS